MAATDLESGVALLIADVNIIDDVINEDATKEVVTPSGNIPSLRKALADNFYFQDPIPWSEGDNETNFNQIRTYTDGTAWWSPSATNINPIPMGSTPIGDSNWYPFQDFNLKKNLIEELTRFKIKGTFAAGFTYETVDDVGLDNSGNPWSYNGSLPFTVVAGTVPSNPDYKQEDFSDHNGKSNRNAVGAHDGIYARDFDSTIDLKAGIDSDGNTVNFSKVIGSRVHWRGYKVKGDGGDGSGIISTGAHTEDGVFIISINSSTYIKVLVGSILDVKKAGIVSTSTPLENTQSLINSIDSEREVIFLPEGIIDINEIDIILTKDLCIIANNTTLRCVEPNPVNYAIRLQTNGFNLKISGNLTIDSNNKSYQGLAIQNESNPVLADVILDDIIVINTYRSGTAFLGGDGLWIRGGFDRVILNNPKVINTRMAAGAGISGSQGAFGISILSNFVGTLMPRFITINNPYIEDVYSEDPNYTEDQDGLRLLGIDSPVVEEGSCNINGGVFKNCWGRSIKGIRPDIIVSNSNFIRTSGNNTGFGNTEIDFQRGGGTVKDIICNYTNFNPVTIVNSFANSQDTYGFNVSGINVILSGTTLDQVVQRFTKASPTPSIPIIIRDVKIVGGIKQILRYLTQNSSSNDTHEYAVLENINFEQADYLAQVFGNNTGQRVEIYAKNCATKGTNVSLIDEGDFSNAVEVRLYEDYMRGFNTFTDSFYIATLTPQSGTVTLNSSQNRLQYMKKGRVVSVYGSVRVLSTSGASGTLSINLPYKSQQGTQLSSLVQATTVVRGSVGKNANDFSINVGPDSSVANLVDISGNLTDDSSVAQLMQNNTELYINIQYVSEPDY